MRYLLILCLLSISLAGLAIPTGLNLMPTADVLTPGESRLDYESSGSGKLNVPPDGMIIGTENGSLFGFEAGVDNITDLGTVYNVKWRFLNSGEGTTQFAIGAQNFGEDAQYYGVLTRKLGRMKISGGMITGVGDADETLSMVGARFDARPLILMADHVQGDTIKRTAGSVGLSMSSFTIIGTAYDFGNDGSTEYTLTLSYGHQY